MTPKALLLRDFLPSKFIIAWAWFFTLLTSYYILKPIRDGLGTVLASQLNYWYLGSFVASIAAITIYAFLANRLSPGWLLIVVYEFFAITLLMFAAARQWNETWSLWLTGSFFIWVSVFNLNTVALFWSIMTDVFDAKESKKWFGLLASAGSVGALAGSGLTFFRIEQWSSAGLLATSFVGLQISIVLGLLSLRKRFHDKNTETARSPVKSSSEAKEPTPTLLDGLLRVASSRFLLGICLFVFIGKFAATYYYNNLQIELKNSSMAEDARTAIFASMNFWTQAGSMVMQGLLFAQLVKWVGVRGVLTIPCLTLIGLMLALFVDASLSVWIIAQVVQQIVGYGLMTPGQNLLFTLLSKQDRYVSKGFIDTVLFRFSDVVAAQLCKALGSIGFSTGFNSLCLVPILCLWGWIAWTLGAKHDKCSQETG